MATKGQKFKHYSSELKRKVVLERINNKTDYIELAYKNGILSQESIMQWVENYKKHGEAAFDDKRGTATAETSKLKGRPRKYFSDSADKNAYMNLVAERNKKRALERRRLARVRKQREARKAEDEAY